jgi:small subunit ribosomal protein S5
LSNRRSRRRENTLTNWIPKTQLGKQVYEGQISSIYEIFNEGYKIKEVEIIDALVPDLSDEVIDINLVQKQTDAGESSRFTALVVVGNSNGLVGLSNKKWMWKLGMRLWRKSYFTIQSIWQNRER